VTQNETAWSQIQAKYDTVFTDVILEGQRMYNDCTENMWENAKSNFVNTIDYNKNMSKAKYTAADFLDDLGIFDPNTLW